MRFTKLNSFIYTVYTGISTICLCLSFSVYAQNIKIGVVDADKIMQDSKPAKIAQDKIQKEATKREKDLETLAGRGRNLLEKLQKDFNNLSETDKVKRKKELDDLDADFRTKQDKYQEEINKIRNSEISTVIANTNAIIRTIAAQEKFDLILQDAVYVNPNFDITNKVLEILNK